MNYVVVGYHEITHTDPAGWQDVREEQIAPACDAWLIDHPYGFVKVMTRETFARTTYGKAMLEKLNG